MGRTALDPRQVEALNMVPCHLHVCDSPKGLGISGPMSGVIEALVALGFATSAESFDLVDLIEAMDSCRVIISGSIWTLEFPGLALPAPTPGMSST